MVVFEGCQIVLDLTTSVKFKDKTQIRKDITSNGGVVSFIVTKKSTHVICNDAEKADISYKCRMAAKYGLPIVSMDWIKHCVEKETLLGTDDYLMAGKSKSDSLKEGKISATRFQKTEKKKTLKPYINVNKFQVWKPDDKNCPKFSSDYQLAKYAVFKNEKMGKKSQMFTVLEVHVDERFSSGNSVHEFKYRVTSHSGAVRQVEKGESGSFAYRFCSNVDEVLGVYSFLYKQEQQHGMTLTHNAFSQHIGSEKFCLIAGELGIESGTMNEEVSDLVELVWHEAHGKLETVLSVPVSSIKMEQIEKAEAILKQIKAAVDSGDSAKTPKLMADFYNNLPHENRDVVNDVANVKAWLSRKNDTCQFVKDMISVSEATNWSVRSSTQSKYKALRCVVDCLSKSSSEYDRVCQHLMSSLSEKSSLQVQSIYAVNRPVENVNFMHEVSNKQELFHASKVDNIVGILSRGLLMPKVVVDDHGGVRSDPGMLGSGIYFASSASTSIQYSTPSKTKGSRFMLVCEVALGDTKEMYQKDLTLTSPPEGYQSVHGVKSTNGMKSAFKDDEFVIYNTAQQRIKYLVEFTTDTDTIKMVDLSINVDNQDEIEDEDNETLSLTDVKGIIDPMSKVKAGLVSKDDTPVNLKSVHIRARLMDLASEVIVLQEYENNSKSPLEAKYVFPLGDMSAVCGFEAFINGKHIVGEVKEKETAHKEYKKAISEGHGAYLMDQDEETPDVFTVSVGNLPAGASVLIKITYVAELQAEGDMISFRLPGSVAPWKKDSLKVETQHETDTVEVEQGETSVQVAIDMPFDIRSIECPTHKIKSKRTLTKATVEMLPDQAIDDGFHLFIGLAEIHVPRMWVERKPGDIEQQACMLTFYPEFEACENDDVSIILMLDLSNSMKGDNLVSAKKILLLTLQQLPPSWNFNIVVFGTAWRELFPSCVTNTTLNRKLASEFVMNVSATMGNTEVVRPMHCLYLLKPESFTQNVFIVSDGHLNNPDVMMKSARDNSQHTRIFTLGIGATADRHLLRNLARGAAGAFEFFDSKAKSKWESKVKSQIHKAAQPGLTSVMVHWEQHGADVPAPVQAPSQITALFNGSRSVIYGYVPNCTMATLTARIGMDEVSTMVSTSDLSITEGNILHRLTAKALIGDWEDGVLSPDRTDHEILKMNTKQFIIELSKEYSIVTQFTSFVAIEKRDEDEERRAVDAPAMWELIELENVDQLQYMGYKEDDMLLEPELMYGEMVAEELMVAEEEMDEEEEMEEDYATMDLSGDVCESLAEPRMTCDLGYSVVRRKKRRKRSLSGSGSRALSRSRSGSSSIMESRSCSRLGSYSRSRSVSRTRDRSHEEKYRSRSREKAYKKPRSRRSRERTNKNQAKTPQEYEQYDDVTSVQNSSMQERSMKDKYQVERKGLNKSYVQKLDLYEETEPLMADMFASVKSAGYKPTSPRMMGRRKVPDDLDMVYKSAANDVSRSMFEEDGDVDMDYAENGVEVTVGGVGYGTQDDEGTVYRVSALKAATQRSIQPEESSDDEDDMGFGLFDDDNAEMESFHSAGGSDYGTQDDDKTAYRPSALEAATKRSIQSEEMGFGLFGNKGMPITGGANKTDLTHDAFSTAVEDRQEDLTVLAEKCFDETPSVEKKKSKKKARDNREDKLGQALSLKATKLCSTNTEPKILLTDNYEPYLEAPASPILASRSERKLERKANQLQEEIKPRKFNSRSTNERASTSGYPQYQQQQMNYYARGAGGGKHAPLLRPSAHFACSRQAAPPLPPQFGAAPLPPPPPPQLQLSDGFSVESILSMQPQLHAARQSATPSWNVASSAPPPPPVDSARTSRLLKSLDTPMGSLPTSRLFRKSSCSSKQPQFFAQFAQSAPPPPPPLSAPIPPPPPPPGSAPLHKPPPLPVRVENYSVKVCGVDSVSPLPALSSQPPQPVVKERSKGRMMQWMSGPIVRDKRAVSSFVKKDGSEIQGEVLFSHKYKENATNATYTKVVNSAAVSAPASWRVESEVTSKRNKLNVHGDKKAKLTSMSGYLDRTDLAMYGIGINIPSISKASGSQLEIKNIESVISMQEMPGSWVMDRKLQELLGIDFAICKGALDKAGLKSLGTKCYDEVIELISTTIVVLCIINCTVPEVFPTNFRHEKAIEDVLKKFQNAVSKLNIREHVITQAIFQAIDFCQKIDEKYPLVCTQLELGQNWTEFAGKLLQLNSNAETPTEVRLGADLAGVSNETCQLEIAV